MIDGGPSLGQVLQVRVGVGGGTDVEAAEVTYAYTGNGKIAAVIDANGNRADYTYDGFDRLERWNFPAKSVVANYDDSSPETALATAAPRAVPADRSHRLRGPVQPLCLCRERSG